MKILAVGGGSGGHVTPVVAVLKELRAQKPRAELRFWSDTKFAPQARATVAAFDDSLRLDTIVAGKLRRYHHLTVWQQLTWPSLVARNIGDSFLVLVGIVQSFFKLLIWRPDVIFTKGGYVCLPVGIAARMLHIPLVIHDSDAHPGLTNRILSKWATAIATGAPLDYYPYDKRKSTYVGIPIDAAFQPVTESQQKSAKQEWGIDPSLPLVVVTGGGLGASRINEAVVASLQDMQRFASVVLVSGAGQHAALVPRLPRNGDRFQLHPFITNMASLLTAADVVVTRAGATTILELAALAKPTVLIPNAKLTGGHQLKNAAVYEAAQAVRIVNEDEMEARPAVLVETVRDLMTHPKAARVLARNFHSFSKPSAAKDVAALILSAV